MLCKSCALNNDVMSIFVESLEVKMKWLKNFERVQMIQQQLVWQPITEMDPRAYVPEVNICYVRCSLIGPCTIWK